jgi:hypothetical protein
MGGSDALFAPALILLPSLQYHRSIWVEAAATATTVAIKQKQWRQWRQRQQRGGS